MDQCGIGADRTNAIGQRSTGIFRACEPYLNTIWFALDSLLRIRCDPSTLAEALLVTSVVITTDAPKPPTLVRTLEVEITSATRRMDL